jgi:magnesium-protoporphyrin IX monomethyl ester (oxidative) cyclase
MDPTEYDHRVFNICSEISRQVFPVVLDSDSPRFSRGLERMRRISGAIDAAKAQGGVFGAIKRLGLIAAAGVTFAGLYFTPVKRNVAPATVRLVPAW